jgi:Zn-dependent protease
MTNCYHCGNNIIGEAFFCNKCGQNYCSLHKERVDHECNILRESFSEPQIHSIIPSYNESPQIISDSSDQGYEQSYSHYTRGTTDGTYTWYRQEAQVPANAFDPDSGIQFKGILFPHKSEFLHFIVASALIFLIGIMLFYDEYLFSIGYGWTTFMLAGIYMTAFLFHEFGHRQVAVRFNLQTKFRLLTFGMVLTVISLVAGLLSIPIPSLALPGAVVVLGLDKVSRTTGLCKAAGPFVNLIYGIILFIISFIIPKSLYPLNYLFVVSSYLNFMLGAFNMLPIGILDGQNIWKWDKRVYLFLALSLVIFLIITLIIQMSNLSVDLYIP